MIKIMNSGKKKLKFTKLVKLTFQNLLRVLNAEIMFTKEKKGHYPSQPNIKVEGYLYVTAKMAIKKGR